MYCILWLYLGCVAESRFRLGCVGVLGLRDEGVVWFGGWFHIPSPHSQHCSHPLMNDMHCCMKGHYTKKIEH